MSLPRVAIAAIFRNERPYVLEWLAHHWALGVRRFYIADNLSDDGSTELLRGMAALGVVRWIPFATPAGRAPQLPAYAELLQHQLDPEEDWVAVIDADEFIMPTQGARTIAEVLAPLAAQHDVGAVVLNWAIHGSAWRSNHSAGLLTERFERRAPQHFGANHHYKTLLRRQALAQVYSNPHHFVLRPGWRHVHTNGHALQAHPQHGWGLSAAVVWDGLRVNHYVLKSREEFDTRKRRAGSAATVGRVKGDDYFAAHDRNEHRDVAPPWLKQATHQHVQDWRVQLQALGVALPEETQAQPRYTAPFVGTRGCVDRLEHRDGHWHFSGWSFQGSGALTPCLTCQIGSQRHVLHDFVRRARPDVQQHYPMAPRDSGFVLSVPGPCLTPGGEDLVALSLQGGEDEHHLGAPFALPSLPILPALQQIPTTVKA